MSLYTYRRRLVLTGCLSLLLFTALFAQVAPVSFSIRHFTDEDGLPQNSVRCLTPDSNGFLWMATENGLVRFDGQQFLIFNSSNLPIQNSRIQYVYPAAHQNDVLLARTANKELLAVHNGRAALAAVPYHDLDSVFYHADIMLYPLADLPDMYLQDARPTHFLVPAASDAYFRIRGDTVRFLKGGKERYRLHYAGLVPANLFAYNEQLYCLDSKGQFIRLDQEGARVLKLEGDLLQHRKTAAGAKHRELLYWNFAAKQLFVYLDQSCYRLELQQDGLIQSSLALKDVDFDSYAVGSVYQDTMHQRVFLGSRTKGLFVCSRRQFRSLKAGGQRDEVYYAQALFGKDKILTPGGAVFNHNGKLTRLSLMDRMGTGDRYSMSRDINGNYWYKNFEDLFKFNRDGSAILWERDTDIEMNQLYADSTGRLWIASKKKGLYYLQTTEDYPQIHIFSARMSDVSYMLRQDDTLWAGTGNGLYRLHLSSGKIDTMPGFNNKYVRSLYMPRKGELWITTYNHGVFLYQHGRVTSLPQDEKKYMATAHCIVEDEKGFLWITTNKGLFQVSGDDVRSYAKGEKQELFYLYYGKDQGFNTNEFNGGCQPCGLKLENGDISLPSLDGLVYFSPGAIRPELPDKQIFIDGAELDTQMTSVDSTISLPNNFHHLRLFISTPYFGDQHNLQLYYSLEEEDSDKGIWLKVSDSRIIEFSSLHSGRYRLRIRKISGFGNNGIMERAFTIRVAQGFYETIWFRLLLLTVIMLMAFAASGFWVRRVNRKNRQLELHVTERTRELKETLDNLRFSEQQLRRQGFIQQRLTAAISHDLKTPLKYVMQVIRKEHNSKAAISNDERNIVYESLYNMFHLVENLISYMKSQFANDDSSLEIADLHLVLEEKANIFRAVSAAKGVAIINDTPPGTRVLLNRQLLAIIIHNLLDNAVKYTRKGHVRLQGAANMEKISIRFEDTGIGMPPLVSAWIRQYKNGVPVTEGKPPTYDGIGLLMVMELLQLINGNISLGANNGSGTVIDITLDVIT